MTEIITVPALTFTRPSEESERIRIKTDTLNSVFSIFNRDGKATMLANNLNENNSTITHYITFRYLSSKRIRVQIEPYEGIFRLTFGILAESATDDTLTSSQILTQKQGSFATGSSSLTSAYGLITMTISSASVMVKYQTYRDNGLVDSDWGTFLTGYSAKHMITGERVMLINDMLPGSDTAVATSTTQGIAIPRPSTLFAPQSDIMYSIPIINPSGDDAGFTGYFADGKFVFSNIHQYPVGTTVSIEGKLYSVIDANYVAPLED